MLNINLENQTTATTSNLSALVDQFAELHTQVKQFEPTLKQYEALKKQLSQEANAFGEGEVRLNGTNSYAVFSAPPKKRELKNIPAFFTAVGLKAFMECASISVSKADKLLTESQKVNLFKISQGSRRLKDAGSFSDVISVALSQTQVRH